MSHSQKCEKSTKPFTKCNCSCKGLAHGVRASILLEEIKQECEARELSYGRFIESIKNYDLEQDCIDSLNDWIASSIVDSLINKVPDENRKEIYKLLKQEHIICVVCCSILKKFEEVDREVDSIVKECSEIIAHLVIRDLSNRPRLVRAAVRKSIEMAMRKVVQAFIDRVSHEKEAKKVLQVVGLVTCPDNYADVDADVHTDVIKYCLKPLVKVKFKEKLEDYINKETVRDFLQGVAERIKTSSPAGQ
ncbi:hypothetical protein [Actinomyces oris]|uniref:Uncharacterized protein n=1 Tax=Actinomyces oris TaxID=544580 RepID=A0AAW8L8N8_9ACTO|nr:hypothetical protein [Actinomyces oris]MDR0178039.1 hypothetical protein [Actinomyces oris]